jgi:hypothetical protein
VLVDLCTVASVCIFFVVNFVLRLVPQKISRSVMLCSRKNRFS